MDSGKKRWSITLFWDQELVDYPLKDLEYNPPGFDQVYDRFSYGQTLRNTSG